MDEAPKSKKEQLIDVLKYFEIGIIVVIGLIAVLLRIVNPSIINAYVDNNIIAYFAITIGAGLITMTMLIRFLIEVMTLRQVDKAFFSSNFRALLIILGIFVVSYLLSTFLSTNTNSSIYGYYTNVAPNLQLWLGLSVIGISLYTLSYRNQKIQETLYQVTTYFFNVLTLLLVVVFIINVIRLDNLSIASIKATTTISLDFTMFFVTFNLFVSFTKYLTAKKDLEKFIAIASIVISTIIFSIVATTSYVILVIGVFVIMAWSLRQNVSLRNTIIFYLLIFFFIQLGTLFTDIRELKLANYSLPVDESINVVTESIQTNPITGSGPNTFLDSFWKYRSERFNSSELFNRDFSKPFSEVLLLIHDIGVLGIIIVVILGFILFRTHLKHSTFQDFDTSSKYLMLITVVAGSLIISSAAVTIYLLLIILVTLYLTNSDEYYRREGIVNYATNTIVETIPPEKNISSSIAVVLNSGIIVSLLVIAILFLQFADYARKYLYNEYTFGKTISELNDPATATVRANEILALQRDIIKDKNNIGLRGDYANNFALTNVAIVRYITDNNEDITPYQDLISQLIETSILSTNKAVELYPNSVTEWRTRANVYNTLAGYKGNSVDIAINSLIKAAQISPNDPRIRLELAVLYISAPDNEKAIEQLRKAVSLKRDYLEARVLLVRLYQKEGRLIDAFDDIRYFLDNVDENHIYYQQIKDIITEYQRQQQSQ